MQNKTNLKIRETIVDRWCK